MRRLREHLHSTEIVGQEEGKNKRSRKMKSKSESSWTMNINLPADHNTIFPLLLAATFSNSESLVKKCLTKLRRSPLFQSPTQLIPIISLIPTLLNSKSAAISSRSAEIVGAASLVSLEINEQIACDCQTVKALASLVIKSERNVSVAACNALLDLCTTSVGRQRLLHFSALQTLIFAFLQVSRSSFPGFLCTRDHGNISSLKLGIKDDELTILLHDVVVDLINTCNIRQLENIPKDISEDLFLFLRKLWSKVHNQMLNEDVLECCQLKNFYLSNITINSLAESIFRLSIIVTPPAVYSHQTVKRNIFCFSDFTFKDFILNRWEVSPFLLRGSSSVLLNQDGIFSSIFQSLSCEKLFPSLVPSILQGQISCLPIVSDELDIFNFLKEVRSKLGCPPIYEQDIRVIKTDKHSKDEVHFFKENPGSCGVKAPHFLLIRDILKCQEACKEGYTIAMRGMEFRSETVAAIADGLASLFGQPSAGANIYLTPPNSQGLARHYDDHCVFVCQLFGSKRWKIFSQPNMQLPRLYDALDTHSIETVDSSMAECSQLLLNEGDILYIPRGFPHEASTDDGGHDEPAEFSMHLTLGIEVEPAFEWEGFVHVALFSWSKTEHQHYPASSSSLSRILDFMSVKLLHVSIGLLGDSDPTFRKACLVAAISEPSDTNSWLDLNQRSTFRNLIGKISSKASFSEAIQSVEAAIQKNEDPFQRISWLQFLSKESETVEESHWDAPFMAAQKMFPPYVEHREKAESEFMHIKSKFCSEVQYKDVSGGYMVLHEKYKKVRKQYMNGMLSLHCN
ncbi:hypothetical protein SLE2022_272100 [Rubroshorea leprosula]